LGISLLFLGREQKAYVQNAFRTAKLAGEKANAEKNFAHGSSILLNFCGDSIEFGCRFT
jgi:hypothetical protein